MLVTLGCAGVDPLFDLRPKPGDAVVSQPQSKWKPASLLEPQDVLAAERNDLKQFALRDQLADGRSRCAALIG